MPRKALKQRPDGRYRCVYDGHYFYGSTSREAYAKLDAYKLEQAQGLRHDMSGITVSEYAEKWLPIHRAKSCTRSKQTYQRILLSFCASVGTESRMKDITHSDIIAYYNSLDGLSSSYIAKHVQTIRGMLYDAFEDGVIPRNPTRDASQPEGTQGTHRPLEPWERDLVHQLASSHRFGIAAMLMLYGGLRRGEVLAFDIDRDCDFKSKRIYIREAVSFSENIRGDISSTKTNAGIRDLPMFEPLFDALKGKHGLAAPSATGARMTESSFTRTWQSYIYHLSLLSDGKPITIRTHDFRHSFCTMICDAGVDIKTAMQWMGHADEKMIRKIYDHVTAQREKAAQENTAALINKMLKGSK